MTSHKSETTPVRLPIRHMTSITWRHQYEISRDESHYSRKTGNWASVIFGKKIQTRLGTSGSVIYGKKSQKRLFRVIWREKISFQNFRILGTELASFLEKNPDEFFNVESIPHSAVWHWFLSLWIFFPKMTLAQFPKFFLPKKSWLYTHEKSLDFFSRNDAGSVPKIRFFEFSLDFFSKNDASSVPGFWIFFQDSRIGVKDSPRCLYGVDPFFSNLAVEEVWFDNGWTYAKCESSNKNS